MVFCYEITLRDQTNWSTSFRASSYVYTSYDDVGFLTFYDKDSAVVAMVSIKDIVVIKVSPCTL